MRRAAVRTGLAAVALMAVLCGGGMPAARASSPQTPIGTWRTIDDRTNKPNGVVQIYERDGLLFGRIMAIDDPRYRAALCDKCGGSEHNQPVMGMEVLRDMHPDGARWDGGTITNPQDGHVYHCKMHLGPDGATLILRGYIGTPILGRTQTWQRMPG